MVKYITEDTLKKYQISTPKSEAEEDRCASLIMACIIANLYSDYSLMRSCSETLSSPASVQEIEEKIERLNPYLGTEITLSEVCETQRTCEDDAIEAYSQYKESVNALEGEIFKADILEKLNEELYEKHHQNFTDCFLYLYYSMVASLVLEYINEEIEYDTLIQELENTKLVPNQKTLDGVFLRKMLKDSNEWIDRYFELYEEKYGELEDEE